MAFAGWYGIAIGLLMLGQWGFFLASGSVPEVRTAPVALGFHLAAEAGTALLLIAAGVGLLRKQAWGRIGMLVALGMLLYTAIVSPGYFAQKGVWALVVMFGVIIIGALLAIRELLQPVQK